MWSNGAVADDDPDDTSPWRRDDWVPESAVPDPDVFDAARRTSAGSPGAIGPPGIDEPPPEDFDGGHADRASGSSLGRRVVAGGVVLALLVGSAGALLRNDDDPEEQPVSTSTPADVEETDRSTTATSSPVTIPPTSIDDGDAAVSSESEPSAIELPDVVVGEVPVWAERTITVPESMASMAPTEVVTLSPSGVVSVTEFPSGRSRSIDASGPGVQRQIAFGDGTIVVFDPTRLLQLRDGEPVVESELSDGIIFVQPWTGTGTFVVTTPTNGSGAPERDYVLRPDGSLELLDNRFTSQTSFFSRVFSPLGDALFNGPGGVYAVGPDNLAQRISTGTLLATGQRHWAIEECDPALRCAYSIVEWGTGTVTPAVLDRIDGFGLLDPSTRISPDGRSIVYRGDSDSPNRRQILDVTVGGSVQAGRINQIVYPDSWASDSSGLFFADGGLWFVDRTNGAAIEIEDLGRTRAVATGAFARE